MMFYMKLLSIVIAVSLDGFGVGMTYGMRKIRINVIGLAIIVSCSGIIVLISMTMGHMIRTFIPQYVTSMIGSFILIGLGLFVLFSIVRQNQSRKKAERVSKTLKSPVQRVTAVIQNPAEADKDQSGIISPSEATVLGTALALDAFAAGLGASMLGYSPLVTAISIALMSGLFLFSGMTLGRFLSKSKTLTKLTYLPPLILITIGIFHLF